MNPYAAPQNEPSDKRSSRRWWSIMLGLCMILVGFVYFQTMRLRQATALAEELRLEAQHQMDLAIEALEQAEAAQQQAGQSLKLNLR